MSDAQKALDDAYENGGFIPRADTYPPKWEADAAAFRAAVACKLDIPYGAGARAQYDLFYPAQEAKGLFVFVHGGYWKARSKSDWSHFAGGAIEHGFDAALIGYPLAPEARISQITQCISAGITVAAAQVDGPIRLAGHSAGGHLVARMAMPGVLPEVVARRVDRIMPISPLSDLRPLLDLSMNEILQLDPAEAVAESPVLGGKRDHIAMNTIVGSQERPAFLDQNRWLAEAWGIEEMILPGRHHFDVIDGLAAGDTPVMRWLMA
ncbi:MAG: alpha/beta hydrolase [Pseudomonadota bacterium]